MAKQPSTDVSTLPETIVDTLNKQLDHASFDDIMALFDDTVDGAISITELEDRSIIEKEKLVGTEFVITGYRQSTGDTGDFVAVKIITRDGDKYLFTDGSTGIKAQLEDFSTRMGPNFRPIHVPKGLRRSDYQVSDPFDPSKKLSATTFYLSNERG